MGGKTAQSTQQVSIPPQVLAQYQSVTGRSEQTANTPFSQYGNEFVAPVNDQQQTGISGVNANANTAQPYYGAATGQIGQAQAGTAPINNAATGLAAASAGAVDPSQIDASTINQYMSPYLGDVLGSESALLNQNNQQQQAGQLGTSISSGAFGGDRTGIAAANLEQQQNLSNANIYSNILNTGYGQALGTAQQQQGVGLAAGQANRAALASAGSELAGIGQTAYGEQANTATTLAGLGTGAQTAGLQGAQAQIGAGTVQQQTQQAQDTAQYNQFLQQQSYPFQVDQFLANIAEGTGALSGSTTTTQQPGGFFSDKRLKHDIKKIGETYDGQSIYSYKMHGDARTHIGLIAQNVEKKHPHAVGVASGYKFVDYGKATEKAANRGHFHEGGGVSGGGRVWQPGAYAVGGSPSIVDAADMNAILSAQAGMYAPMSGGAGVYGATGNVPRGGSSRVPAPSGAVSHLVTASGGLKAQPSALENAKNMSDLGTSASKLYAEYKKDHPNQDAPSPTADAAPAPAATPGDTPVARRSGGVVARRGYDGGGSTDGMDAILKAQEAMYAPHNQNRDVPNESGGSHQLAVASGSPSPQPSGASNVNQAIGLAQKGYKAYKHFNPPKQPNSGAPNSGDIAGDTSGSTTGGNSLSGMGVDPGAAPTMPPIEGADTSGLGAADTAAPVADSAVGVAAPAAEGAAAETAAPIVASGAAEMAAPAVMAGGTDAAVTDAIAAAAIEAAAADAAPAILAARRGGRMRGKFDAGGTPYEATPAGNPYSSDSGQMNIPDTQNSTALKTAGPLQKHPTGLQTLETLGTQEGAQGAVSGMFSNSALARGGGVAARQRMDTGGAPDDDPTAGGTLMWPVGSDERVAQDAKIASKQTGAGKTVPSALTDSEQSEFDKLRTIQSAGSPSAAGIPQGKWGTRPQPQAPEGMAGLQAATRPRLAELQAKDSAFKDWQSQQQDAADAARRQAQVQSLATQYGVNAPPPGQPPQASTVPPVAPRRPAPAPPSGVAGAADQGPPKDLPGATPTYTGGVGLSPTPAPDVQPPAKVGVDKPTWWDKIKDGPLAKPENLIPLLTAIGAMGTAPTRSLGVAAASGLTAGAQSYLPTQQALADIQQTGQQTQRIGAETRGQNIQNLASLQKQYSFSKMALYEDPNGPIPAIGPDGQVHHYVSKPMSASMGTAGQPSGAPAQYNYLGAQGMEAAKGAGVRYSMMPDAAQAESSKQINEAYDAGSAAQGRMPTLQRWESSIAANPDGVLAPGAFHELRTDAANMWNSGMDQLGHPEYKINGLEDAQMAEKTSKGNAAAAEAAGQQRSFNALKAFLQQTPNPTMQRGAALSLISDMHMENQQAIDKKNYYDEFDKENQWQFGAPIPRNYLSTEANQAFDKEYRPDTYNGERDKLSTILQSRDYGKLRALVNDSSEADKQTTFKKIDDRYGKNFHRYFTGS